MKKVAIIQSSYIPWKGYFDIVHDVDLFLFYDDVQFTVRDWRNRNKIKTHQGTTWLTIPVGSHLNRLIYEVELSDNYWAKKHWKTIKHYYSNAPYFKMYKDFLENLYLNMKWNNLSELNQFLIVSISRDFLGIKTDFRDSREYNLSGKKLDRLIELLKKAEANMYITGPSAKSYIEEKIFEDTEIELIYKSYDGYPEYQQFYPPFDHNVTILDLLFHVGPEAPYHIWGWREATH